VEDDAIMKTLVTGATGFIGSAIVRDLLEDGAEVRVLVRERSDTRNIDGLDVERARGDIRDGDAMKRALNGCDTLYFTAALFAHWTRNIDRLYEVNVGGTRASLRAALEVGLEKVVYTSTNNAIAASGPVPTDEEAVFNYWQSGDHYSMSKYVAENEARGFVARGLPVVIVNPTLVIGTNDAKPTPSGQMIIDVVKRRMPGYIDGGINVIDVDDVSRGHILAAEKGRVGERYLLGNRNLTVHEYLELIADIAGVTPPKTRLPYRLALAFAYVSEFGAAITKKPPVVTASEVRIAKMREWYDCSKAVNELGLPQTPIETAIRKAITWFRENGYLS
jgi:dihydroflavonol-4-reductase